MKLNLPSAGITFVQYVPKGQTPFERLFEIFKELITHTSGDFDEAIEWLRELDKEYGLTNSEYTIDDFIKDLLKQAYIQPKGDGKGDGGGMSLTAKTEKLLREHALKQVFGKLKKAGNGNHKTKSTGQGADDTGEFKAYQFGDPLEKISMTESLRNAQIRTAGDDFTLHCLLYTSPSPRD